MMAALSTLPAIIEHTGVLCHSNGVTDENRRPDYSIRRDILESVSPEDAQTLANMIYEMMDSMRKIQDSNQITGGHLCVHRAHKALVVLGDRHAVLPARCFIEKLDCSPYEATNGGFGTIKRGIWNGVDIAVKTLHSRPDISQLKANQRLCREIATLLRLSHERILPILGVYQEGTKLALISPWYNNGNVDEYLTRDPAHHTHIRRLLIEIAEALVYLHSARVVHGDLHPKNVLLDDGGHARLCDFGLSGFADASKANSLSGGLAGYIPPELIQPSRIDTRPPQLTASDIFSFASICLQVYTGRPPFGYLHEIAVALSIIEGRRPARPAAEKCRGGVGIPDALWEIMQLCWDQRPEGRPDAATVLAKLQRTEF